MKFKAYMTAAAILAGSLTMAVPVTAWADTTSPVLVAPAEEEEDPTEEMAADQETEEVLSQVIEAGTGGRN